MNNRIICKSVGIPNARYQQIFFENNIQISDEAEEWEILFLDKRTSLLKQMQAVSPSIDGKCRYIMSVPGSLAFTHRKNVWINLVKFYGREFSSKIMPETFILDHDPDLDIMLERFPFNPFILKTGEHRRSGLKIVNNAVEAVLEKDNFLIAQLMMTDLYQINHTSLNFRSYLLITLQDDLLTAYIFHDSICIYGLPDIDDLNAKITNTANPVPKGFPFLLSAFCKQEQIDYSDFLINLGNKVNDIINASASKLGRMKNLSNYYCFGIFGIDVLLDKNKKPLICEINNYPSMIAKNACSEILKNDMLSDALSVVGLRKEVNSGFIKTMEVFIS